MLSSLVVSSSPISSDSGRLWSVETEGAPAGATPRAGPPATVTPRARSSWVSTLAPWTAGSAALRNGWSVSAASFTSSAPSGPASRDVA